jgi:exodeoxyribonuclease VII large subunit
VLVIPAKVQGAGAAEQIARGIELAAEIRPGLDVLIVGRGGGSIEDLWCFNEEVVVRAVAACPIPTVSAVGHEVDVTLCDLAADIRALTPSEAAERVVPNQDEFRELLRAVQNRLHVLMRHKLRELEMRCMGIVTRPVMENPSQMLDTATQKLDDTERRLVDGLTKRMEQNDRSFEKLTTRLESISPLRTLARGYSFTTDDATGKIIVDTDQVRVGQSIRTRIMEGALRSQVISIESNQLD